VFHLLPALKIYSLRYVRYRFPALAVNFGTQPQCEKVRERERERERERKRVKENAKVYKRTRKGE